MGFLLLRSLKEVSTPTLFWASILIALAFKYFILRLNNGRRKMNLPPGPPKLPIIGNLHQVRELPTASFHKLSQKYGPIMFLQLGEIPTVIVSSPQMAKEVLKTHDLTFSTRAQIYAAKYLFYNYTDIAFAPYGAFWRSIRKLAVLELFSLRRVQQYAYVRAEEVGNLIQRIADSCASGPVDVSKNLDYYGNDVMCRVSVGKIFTGGGEFEKYGFQKMLESYMELLGGFTLGDYFPSFECIRTLTGMKSRLLKTWKRFDQLWDEIISQHLNAERKPEDKKDLLDVLLDIHKNGTADVALTMDNIKAILLDMFAAGTDTTFITLDWAMAELITHPIAMKKVQAEIRSIIGERRVVQEADLPQLPYFKAVVKEVFRLRPPTPLTLPREAMEDVIIDGYDIPAKTRIYVNIWGMGRDPKVWENPENFEPERFMDSNIDYKGQDFELLPFGAGRRSCPAVAFGAVTVELALAQLLHSFDWELPAGVKAEDIDKTEVFGISMSRKSHLHLIAKPHFH